MEGRANVSDRYPAYHYVHQLESNPLQAELVAAIAEQRQQLYQLREGRFTRSQDVEKVLRPAFLESGFLHSVTNQQVESLFSPGSDFELDFWHPGHSMAIEVEKGKHFNIWRDVCKFAESNKVEHAVLIIPYEKGNKRGHPDQIFLCAIDALNNVSKLFADLNSFLVIGY